MAGIGISVREQHVVVRPCDHLQHPVVNQARAQRQIARRQTLGRRDEIRDDAEHVFRGEPVSQSPERRHHLVRDVEHIVFPADLQRAPVVAFGRDDHATGAQHGFRDERADPVRSDPEDRLFQVIDLPVTPVVQRHAIGTQMRRHIRQEVHLVLQNVEVTEITLLSGNRGRQIGRAVVAFLPRQNDLLVGQSTPIVHEVHGAQRGIDRGRSAAGELHGVHALRSQFGQFRRQLGRRFGRRQPW